MENEEIVKEIRAGININGNMLKLWNNMKYLITTVARKFQGYAELEDLQQEGFISLYAAVLHYEENKGVKFSTYAVYWIKMKMNRYICECTRGIKIYEKEEYIRRKHEKFISDYEKEHGKQPSKGEICQFLNVDIETLGKIEKIENLAKISSTDSPVESEDENSILIIDTIPSPENEDSIIEQIDNNMLLAGVWKIVEGLPELENKVILYKYRHDLNTKEISKKINISERDVSKVHTKAIRKLRNNRSIRELGQHYNDTIVKEYYQHVGAKAYNTTWTSITEHVAIGL